MEHEMQIPIWFFIGVILAIYGLLIFATGVYHVFVPVPVPEQVKLYGLHADLWWGVLLLVLGLVYVRKYKPGKK